MSKTLTKHDLECKLEECSRVLRQNGWTVIRPDPFRNVRPTQLPTIATETVAAIIAAEKVDSIPVKKQEVKSVPAKKARPKREYKSVNKRGSTEEQRKLSAYRLEVIRKHAGEIPSKQIAEMLQISTGNLSRIASEAGISLKIVI